MEELLNNYKEIRFSRSGGSHKNRAADHSIKTVVTMARTILIHSALIFSEDIFSTDLFPM